MIKQLIKVPRKVNCVVLGVLLQFMFSNVLLASEGKTTLPTVKSQYSQQITVSGTITSAEDKLPIPGVTIMVKGNSKMGVISDYDGKYKITIPSSGATLVFSSIGFKTIEKQIKGQSVVNVVMSVDQTTLNEIVIVGYGKQKKESVVAAISQVSGKTLERAGGVQSIGAALTGNAPGLITTASTGMPGEEDPRIVIRGASTWNDSSPLVLVDGIERPMNSVDIGSVETVSVLKDASATAVYGSRGANGVILITTKRGSLGKALIRARVNTTMKVPSQLPNKLDSYDGLMVRNRAIENELALTPSAWNDYLPQAIIDKYRFQTTQEDRERYPNVDWQDTLFKDYAMTYNASLNVSGGTEFVKYFASADFLSEGDLFEKYNNNRGYDPGYGYNRLNVRTNLDFQITPSTTFKVNLAGSHAVKKSPWGASGAEYTIWDAAYSTAPDVFLPYYASDNSWGFYSPNVGQASNSVRNLAISGVQYVTTTRLTTDFTLNQNLDMLVKGLNFTGTIALDNSFIEGNRGVNDLFNNTQQKWIDPVTGLATYTQNYDINNRFDFQEGVKWTPSAGEVRDGSTYRRLFYQGQINYALTLGSKHDITAMGLFNRNEGATGSEVPRYREDWVFRTSYGYAGKYFAEYNGAYNGSEKFAAGNRFAFFSSGGVSWVVSKEGFMKKTASFLDLLKIRANYGEIGDDNVNGRWLYLTQWGFGGRSQLGTSGEGGELSPYDWYRETAVGNPGVQWETAEKSNLGVDFGFFKGLIKGSVDFFNEERSDVLLSGGSRAIPSYYGAVAPVANLGRVRNQGYEFEVKLNYTFANGFNLWSDLNMSHSKNKIIDANNPVLFPEYQKSENKSIGQAFSYVAQGYYNNWDELYGSTIQDTNNNQKLPGNYNLLDYNADGVINAYDNIPYGFTGTPQNTYNATVGFNWKKFSGFVQFYGVNNVTRQVVLGSLVSQNHVVYDQGSLWNKDNVEANNPMPRWLSTPSGYNNAQRYMYDGSYLRLKNAEIAYTFDESNSSIKSWGIQNVRVFINGDNLYIWSKMPDDRESNFAGTGWASQGAYPTVKRFNLGANIIF
ncbi:SusC/RagA family TonB-linked outer membrane protein [Flavobacterium franklandianum]|uniref:SusC/RagA family TonB-linked outer membrane protein n=3 Tax=Flavobacterium TaxID=237 RepID=A0A553C688_9FLAO|nr:SusC/RagA family TonB-linked outer membrane protein [Flavobacterium franklandianum]TRX16039.1 SusC/RagA family TonB-linked outer membrane protein [Flavobacterium franklandianum]